MTLAATILYFLAWWTGIAVVVLALIAFLGRRSDVRDDMSGP